MKIKPDYTPALGDLGISLLRLGKLEAAMATLQEAISLVSGFIEIYGHWREGSSRIGKDNETINFNANLLTVIQKRSPGETYFWLGELLARQNILNLAIICYQKALEALQKTGCCGSFFGLLLRRFCLMTTRPSASNARLEDIFVHADKLLDILKFAGAGS